VDRSTINRDLADLPASIYIDDADGNKLKIDRNADLINLNINLHEAMAFHLASRLLATRMDRKNPHAASALRKLGLSMEKWASRLSQHVILSADMMDGEVQKDDANYVRVLEVLTEGWANSQKVKIWHRSERINKTFEYTVSPYFIEPYAIGQTTQLICFSEPPGAIRTYKIERIERAEKTNDSYKIPEIFDPRALLADAWGIWYTDREPTTVVLRFSQRVANRVKESLWHPSQKLVDQDDGSTIWQATIAEPQEMLPWIRGWGADCEVLEPTTFRST
jgi:CRISPR-associated endonuclease/helicase Cas3